jgi:WD40 repeat protein
MEPNEELSLEWGSCMELSVEDQLVDDDGSLRNEIQKPMDLRRQNVQMNLRRRKMMLETVAFGGGDGCWIFGTREKLEGIKAWKLEVTGTTSRISFERIMCSYTDKKDGKFQLMSNLKGTKAPREPMAGGALVATKQYLVAGAKDGCVYVWDISRLRSRDGGRCDVAASFVLRATSFTFDPTLGEFPIQYLAAGTKTLPVVAEVAHKCHEALLELREMRRDIFVRSIEKKDILATLIDASTERGGTLLQISPLKRTFTKKLKVEELEIVHSGHTSKVNEVTCKGNRIASASNAPGKGTVIVWDSDMTMAAKERYPTEVVKSGTEGGLKATAAKKDKTEVDWHRCLAMYESDECISSLAFTSDSNRILVGGSSIVIFELVTVRRNSHFTVLFDRIQTLHGWSNSQQELGTYRTIALSNDDAVLISGSSDLTLRVWDLATGACRRTMTRPKYKRQKNHTDAADSFVGIPAAVASPDGKCVAFGGNGHLMVSIACDNVITVKNKWPTW